LEQNIITTQEKNFYSAIFVSMADDIEIPEIPVLSKCMQNIAQHQNSQILTILSTQKQSLSPSTEQC
jgi:hypothetical protein